MQQSTDTMIDELIENLQISQAQFAKQLNVTSGAITNWKKRNLGANVINKIVNAFPQVSREWLMTGEGEIFKVNSFGGVKESPRLRGFSAEKIAESIQQGIPLIPTNAMAGALDGCDCQYMDYDIEDRIVVPAFRKSDFAIRVEGDSMEPRYLRGDIIACQNVPLNDIWFQWGKVYVISTTQGVLVKHVEPGTDTNHIKLVSDNQAYSPFEIPTDELHGVAIVNGLIRVE